MTDEVTPLSKEEREESLQLSLAKHADMDAYHARVAIARKTIPRWNATVEMLEAEVEGLRSTIGEFLRVQCGRCPGSKDGSCTATTLRTILEETTDAE